MTEMGRAAGSPVTAGDRPSQVTVKTVLTVLATVSAVLLMIAVVISARVALAFIAASAFLASALYHGVAWLKRRRVPHGLAIAVVVTAVLGLLAGILVVVVPAAVQQGETFARRAPEMLRRVQESPGYQVLDRHLNITSQIRQSMGALPERLQESVGAALRAPGSVFSVVASAISIFFLPLFMLVYGDRLVKSGLDEVTPMNRARVRRVLEKVYLSVGGYLGGISLVCLINATLTTSMMALLRLPFFLPLGLLSGSSSLIPYAGPTVVGTLITLITALTAGLWKGVAMAIFFVAYGQLEGNVISPLVFRRAVNVNPLISIASLVIFGEIAGVLGAIFAVPLAAMSQVLLRELLILRRERLQLPLTGAAGSDEDLPAVAREKLAQEAGAHGPHH